MKDLQDKYGISWTVVDPAELIPLLDREHYLGPLKSGMLGIAGYDLVDNLVAGMIWRRPTARRLPADGSWLELSRWCLTPAAGPNAGSRSHWAAVRIIKELQRNTKTLLSYSDPSVGHRGELYRACNYLWAPTWHRLRPPPTGLGSWDGETSQAVKDRWVFPLRKNPALPELVSIRDPGAIRRWVSSHPSETEVRLALQSPAPDLAEAARTIQRNQKC